MSGLGAKAYKVCPDLYGTLKIRHTYHRYREHNRKTRGVQVGFKVGVPAAELRLNS